MSVGRKMECIKSDNSKTVGLECYEVKMKCIDSVAASESGRGTVINHLNLAHMEGSLKTPHVGF